MHMLLLLFDVISQYHNYLVDLRLINFLSLPDVCHITGVSVYFASLSLANILQCLTDCYSFGDC